MSIVGASIRIAVRIARRLALQPGEPPLHSVLEFTGEAHFQHAGLDVDLQRHDIQFLDGRLDLVPFDRRRLDHQLVVLLDRRDADVRILVASTRGRSGSGRRLLVLRLRLAGIAVVHVAPTGALLGRQQVGLSASFAGRCLPAVDAVELGAGRGQRGQFVVELPTRDQHEFDLCIATAGIVAEHAAVEVDQVGLERRLPVHLEREHLAQVLGRRRGQAQRAREHALGRNAEHGAHLRIVERITQSAEFRGLCFDRQVAPYARVLARCVAPLAPDDQFFGAQVEQQGFRALGQQRAPAHRQASHQLAPPPGEKARQRRLGKARPQTRELSVECRVHGQEFSPSRQRRIT